MIARLRGGRKAADLVVLNGNPAKQISDVEKVASSGIGLASIRQN